ncbi:MAG TPA: amino acid permease [Longimicrobiales bacterium]|nr:amino acid permease [Longimicrobiales bacterium]
MPRNRAGWGATGVPLADRRACLDRRRPGRGGGGAVASRARPAGYPPRAGAVILLRFRRAFPGAALLPEPPEPVLTERISPAVESAAREERLPRRLGLWSAVAVAVGSTIGSGIFRVPSSVAAEIGSVGALALAWIAGAVVALFGALTLAELATMYPRSGGIYVFIREAFGPLPAFLFGWTELVVIRPSALGAIAMIFAEYLGNFVPLTDFTTRLVAAAAIIGLCSANIRSVDWGAVVENATTSAKVIALAGLALVAFLFAKGGEGALAQPVGFRPLSWGGFGVALIAVLWAYDGWADLTFMSGEVKDPGRTMPRALLGGALIVAAVYLLVNAAYLYVLPLDVMSQSKLVAADTATRVFGAAGAGIVSALVILSTFGALNASVMTGPRILYAMADDGLFFRPIAAVHPRWRTPWASIALCGALGVGYVSIQTFEQLADAFILGIWPFYALAVAAVFIMRRRRPDAERPYRTPGYPIVPLVFLVASVALLGNAVVQQTFSTLVGFGIILLGVPVFYLWRWRRSRPRPAR